MADDLFSILNDPSRCLSRARDLLISTSSREDYPQSQERNGDLSVLAAALHYRLLLDPGLLYKQDEIATTFKEIIVCAYLLGRRDDQAVPDIFKEAPDAR